MAPAGDRPGSVIPNGVAALDVSDFPRPSEYPDDGFVVLLVGRVDEVKGHDVAIDAFDDPSVPDDIVLFVLGDGPLRPALEAGLASRGLGGQVRFLGFRSNIFDYIAHCDVLTMPSRHEGLPYTLLEAMALERPVLASRVGGLAEVLADGETAVLVEQGKPAALREGLLRLYRDPALRARLGQQAGAERSRRYSLDAMARRYLDIYRSTTGG